MKNLLTLLAIVSLSSCGTNNPVDLAVDKSQLKYETETEAIYPFSAVTPIANSDAINTKLQELIDTANESLKNATK